MNQKSNRTELRKNKKRDYRLWCLLVYALLIFPVFYSRFKNGLETSWEYALNRIGLLPGIKFGSEVVSTYGPLGFLQAPMYIGRRYLIAWGIYLVYWVSSTALFWRLLRSRTVEALSVAIGLFFLFIGSPARAGELYVQYCALMALAVLWKDMSDPFAAVFYVVSATVAFYMKFSAATAVIGCAALLLAVKLVLGERRRVWVLLLPCLTVPVCYLIYNPSLSGFIGYIRGGLEVSDGYSTAMSLSTLDANAIWVFLMIAVYVAMIVDALRHGSENGWMMIWMAPCLFMAYKHGFVRADTKHVVDASAEITSLFSVLLLLFRSRKERRMQSCLMLALIGLFLVSYDNGIKPFNTLFDRYAGIPKAFTEMSEEGCRENREELTGIPEAMLKVIGDDTFTSYPIEITFIEKTPETAMHFVPLAALQGYSTYTPYLDGLVADQLGAEDAPKYIIFRFDAIDNRLPLLEAPAAWKAMLNHYRLRADASADGWYLLERRPGITASGEDIQTEVCKKTDEIRLEDCSEARIYVDLSLWGRLTKTFWKIPKVMAKVTYSNDITWEGRVLPENLRDGIVIRGLPNDHNTLFSALQGGGLACTIRSIELYGPGLKYYGDAVRVEKVRYTEERQPDFSEFRQVQLDLSELTPGAEGEAKAYTDMVTTNPYFACSGWAVTIGESRDYRMYVRLQGNYYECVKLPGRDVLEHFEMRGDVNVRFQVCVPAEADEDSALLMVTGDRYYEFPIHT